MRHCPKGSIRSQHDRSDFVTGGDTLEQLIGSTLVDGQIVQLIEEENETTFAIVTRVSGGSMMSAASDDGNRRLRQPRGTGGQYDRELNPLKTVTENFPGANSPPIGLPSRSVRPGPRFDCCPGWPEVFAGCPWVTVMPVTPE
jgi:hypothetical protein